MKRINQKGQALVEYVLIIALVAVMIIGVISTFGGVLRDKITEVSCSISGQVYDDGGDNKSGDGFCKAVFFCHVHHFDAFNYVGFI